MSERTWPCSQPDRPSRWRADHVNESDRDPTNTTDVVVTFVRSRAALSNELEKLGQVVSSGGGLWIAWPKRSSGIATTLSDDVVRELALPMGLVDNKVCAIDATWSGLRFVWRRTAPRRQVIHDRRDTNHVR